MKHRKTLRSNGIHVLVFLSYWIYFSQCNVWIKDRFLIFRVTQKCLDSALVNFSNKISRPCFLLIFWMCYMVLGNFTLLILELWVWDVVRIWTYFGIYVIEFKAQSHSVSLFLLATWKAMFCQGLFLPKAQRVSGSQT